MVSTMNQSPARSPNLSQTEQTRRRRHSKSASAQPVCSSAGLNRAGRRDDGGACGHPDRTMLLWAGRRACTHITHTARAHTLTHSSHRRSTHGTPQVHTLHRQTCTHITHNPGHNSHRRSTHEHPRDIHSTGGRAHAHAHCTHVLFSAKGHAEAQQLEGLKTQLLRKADFLVMPPRPRWGQRETQ